MEQPQKHWIQATLGEDPYTPFPYFYDVSSWSNLLLAGVDTVYSGDVVAPKAERVRKMEGGVAQGASKKGSYSFPLDSSSASELTFKLLEQGVALKRDLTTGVVSFSPTEVDRAELDELATSLGVTVSAGGSALAGTALVSPDLGLFNGTGISTTSGSYGEARYVLGGPLGHRPQAGRHRGHQQQHRRLHRPLRPARAGRQQRHRRSDRPGPGQPQGVGGQRRNLHRSPQRGHPAWPARPV